MGGSEVRRMEDGERNKWAKLTHICHILLSSPGNPTCMRRSYVIYTNNLCVTHKDTRNINNETNKFFIFICKFNEISPDDIYKISNYKVCNKSGFISSYCIIYKHAYHSIKLLLIKALMGLGYRCSMKTSSLSNTIKRVSWYDMSISRSQLKKCRIWKSNQNSKTEILSQRISDSIAAWEKSIYYNMIWNNTLAMNNFINHKIKYYV